MMAKSAISYTAISIYFIVDVMPDEQSKKAMQYIYITPMWYKLYNLYLFHLC